MVRVVLDEGFQRLDPRLVLLFRDLGLGGFEFGFRDPASGDEVERRSDQNGHDDKARQPQHQRGADGIGFARSLVGPHHLLETVTNARPFRHLFDSIVDLVDFLKGILDLLRRGKFGRLRRGSGWGGWSFVFDHIEQIVVVRSRFLLRTPAALLAVIGEHLQALHQRFVGLRRLGFFRRRGGGFLRLDGFLLLGQVA